jgi:hypothetical protein
MNLFNKRPAFERAPAGRALLRRLPLFSVAGTVDADAPIP